MAHIGKPAAEPNRSFIQKRGQRIEVVIFDVVGRYWIGAIELKKGRNDMGRVKRYEVSIVCHFPVVLDAGPEQNGECEHD